MTSYPDSLLFLLFHPRRLFIHWKLSNYIIETVETHFFPMKIKLGKESKEPWKASFFLYHLHMDFNDQSVKKTLLGFYNRKVDPTFNYRLFPNFLLSYNPSWVCHSLFSFFVLKEHKKTCQRETARKELYLSKQGLCFSSFITLKSLLQPRLLCALRHGFTCSIHYWNHQVKMKIKNGPGKKK